MPHRLLPGPSRSAGFGRPLAAAFWALAVVIAGSRVYLGVHYPLDVVGGMLVGLACSYFVTGGLTYRRNSPSAALDVLR